MKRILFFALFALGLCEAVYAADVPKYVEGDFVMRDFKFASGEVLPELRLHYRTLGQPRKDASGVVRNAVLVMHGTEDRALPFDATAARLPALIADCTLVPVEGGPHNIAWTHPDEVNGALLEFIPA